MSNSWSPWDLAVRPNPHPMYADMRTNDPVHRAIGPVTGRPFWFLTKYDDCAAALRHKSIGKEIEKHIPEAAFELEDNGVEMFGKSMLFVDPPDHTRLRRLVSAGFTPRSIHALEPRMRTISNDLIQKLAGRRNFDLINDYAFQFPVTVIAELLGVPATDHDAFRRWTKTLLFGLPDETQLAGMEFVNYMNDQINGRRAEPTDDLISGLVHAEDEGDKLDHTETLSMILLLLIAGHETTVNLIGNGMRALLAAPDERQLLIDHPELMESAIEEFLRFDGPVEISTLRFAFEDVEIGGVTIPAGELVIPTLLAANRDPSQFTEPDRLNVRRSPNKHLGFGAGIHLCLGSTLARLEGAVAFEHLLRSYPTMAPAIEDEHIAWNEALFLRGMKAYPVTAAP